MNVFFSWSGETSRELAELFVNWLPKVVQKTEPFFSPNDVAKGTRWATEIATHLEGCSIGFLFMTSQNLSAPWIMFEAGALSKHIADSRICCLLFGVGVGDIKGPLEQFNHAVFRKDEIYRIVLAANDVLPGRILPHDQVTEIFDVWWPELEKDVSTLLADAVANNKETMPLPQRMTDAEYFKEMNSLLEMMRATVRRVAASASPSHNFDESVITHAQADFYEKTLVDTINAQFESAVTHVLISIGDKFITITMSDTYKGDNSMRRDIRAFLDKIIADSPFADYGMRIRS